MAGKDSDIPVSLEFFKKCTYHEEFVEKIAVACAGGNAQKLEEYLSSEIWKRTSLRKYYRSFYLEPGTRKDCPIRYKAMPQKQKMKLLQYPKTNNQLAVCQRLKKAAAADLCKERDTDQLVVVDDEEPDGDDDVPTTSTKRNANMSISTLSSASGEALTESNFKEQPSAKRLKTGEDCTPANYTLQSHTESIDNAQNNDANDLVEIVLSDDDVPTTSTKRNANMSISTLSSASGEALTESNFKEQPPAKRLKTGEDCTPANYTLQSHTESIDNAQNNDANDLVEIVLSDDDVPTTSTKRNANMSISTLSSASGEALTESNIKEQLSAKGLINTDEERTEFNYAIQNRTESIDNALNNNDSCIQSATNCSLKECPTNDMNQAAVNAKERLVPSTLANDVVETVEHPPAQLESPIRYADLKKLAHNCPVKWSKFKKYTNVIELARSDCKIMYGNPNTNLHHFATKMYLMFYIHPEFRALSELMKQIKVSPHCPKALKSEIFKIPDIKEKTKENDEQPIAQEPVDTNNNNSESVFADGKTEEGESSSKEVPSRRNSNENDCASDTDNPIIVQKPNVEILEDRLLPNLPMETMHLYTKDPSCKFCQITMEEFIANTNVNEVLEKLGACGEDVIRDFFRRFMQLEEESFKSLVISGSLALTIIKCPNVCANCERNWQSHLTSQDNEIQGEVVVTSPGIEKVENSSNPHNAIDIGNNLKKWIYVNNELCSKFSHELLDALREPFDYSLFPVSIREFKLCSMYKEPLKQIICDFCGPEVDLVQCFVKNTELYNSLVLYYYRKFFTNPNLRKKYPLKLKMCPASLRDKMLAFVAATADKGIQVMRKGSPDTRQQTDDASIIDQKTCVPSDNAVARQSGPPHQQIAKSPQNYAKLLATNSKNKPQAALKSPSSRRASVRSPATKEHNSLLQHQESILSGADNILPSSGNQSGTITVDNVTNQTPTCNENKQKEITPTNSGENKNVPEKSTCSIITDEVVEAELTCLEKESVHRTHTLAYLLRTSFGLKQRITQTLSELSLQEFKAITHIYQGQQSYDDDKLLQCMYDRVCKLSVWPKNLYIKLEDLLFKLVQAEIISESTADPTVMLTYISPKFLHWSNLMSTTNFLSCVCSDYLYHSGEVFDKTNTNIVEAECKNYYNRCWSHEQWIGEIPKVNPNLLLTLCANKTGANTVSTSDVIVHRVRLQPPIEEGTANIENAGNVNTDKSPENICTDVIKDMAISNSNNAISHKEPKDNTIVNEVSTQTLGDTSLLGTAGDNIQEEIICTNGNDNLNNISYKLVEEINECTQRSDDSFNNANYVTIPNTQAQIDTLPSETTVRDIMDPLQDICSKHDGGGFSIGSDVNCTTHVAIKVEMNAPLRDLKFLEHADGNIECVTLEKEVIDLDTTIDFNQNDESGILPLSQIDFGDDEINANHKSAQKCSSDLLCSGSSGSSFTLGQRLPSYCSSSDTTNGSIILSNSDGNDQNNEDNILETSTTVANLSRVASNVECIGVSQEADTAYPKPTVFVIAETENADDNINIITKQKKNETKTTNRDIVPQKTHTFRPLPLNTRRHSSSSSTIVTSTQKTSICPSKEQQVGNIIEKNMPRRRSSRFASLTGLEPTVTSTQTSSKEQTVPNTIEKNIPKRRSSRYASVTDSEPPTSTPHLLQQTAYMDNATNKNKLGTRSSRMTQDKDTCDEISSELVPAVTSIQTGSTFRHQVISQVSSSKLQANLHQESLRVSQELLMDSSIFNNTSLLRAADQMSDPATAITAKLDESPLDVDNTVFNTTSLLRVVDRNYSHPPKVPSTLPKTPVMVNSTTTAGTCGYKDRPLKRRRIIYQNLLDFHYFKRLNRNHISKYQLSTINYGSTQFESTIVCCDLKTRLTNKSLDPFLSSCLSRPDFFVLLKDVDEFHYSPFRQSTIGQEKDIRQRVLFWYIHTSSPFYYAQLAYDEYNSEFSTCTSIRNLGTCVNRRTCVTNALSPHILNKLTKLKEDIRNGIK